jgi:hypothetical protein
MFHDHDGFHHGAGALGLLVGAFVIAAVVIGLMALVERPWSRADSTDIRVHREQPVGIARGLSLVALAIGGGFVFGVLDRVLAHGPPWALDLSNVGALWLVVAFLVGITAPTRSMGAVLGWLCLLAALAGYYGYLGVIEHTGPTTYIEHRAAPWVVASCVVGPLFGALGADWRHRRSWTAGMGLAGAVVADGIMFLVFAGNGSGHDSLVHGVVIAAGIVLALGVAISRHRQSPRQARAQPA